MKPLAALILTALVGTACSTAPKGGPPETRLTRRAAESQLALANQAADRGNYPLALELLEETRRLALSADYSPVLIQAALSRGAVLFFQGDRAGAEAAWQNALEEADGANQRELAALCRIYMARGRLFAAIQNKNGPEKAGEVRSQAQAALGVITKDAASIAFGWTVIGLAEKELGRWDEAERALKKALAVYTEQGYWEQAGYVWYVIASVRSVAGRFTEAAAALQEALAYDRRTENGYALGKDWMALGGVFAKAGRKQDAGAAYRRAAAIFRAIDREADAAQADAARRE